MGRKKKNNKIKKSKIYKNKKKKEKVAFDQPARQTTFKPKNLN